ncbi:MAG: glycine oxidase ThiO [Candidatus Poribacteria bacterium]|nr:glycine oxidase ThiO [Candidatus Poribacteria bacterium]
MRGSKESVVIIGGGIIGLGIGWQLAKSGCEVTIYERDRAGRAASWAAAGMLAPIAEVHFEERELLELGSASLRLYPEWVRELESDTQMSVGFRQEGTLIVGVDRDDAGLLQHFFDSQRLLGLNAEWLTGAEARDIEPLLSPQITAAISCEDDHQVDNRLMVSALMTAFRIAGGTLSEGTPVSKIEVQNGKARGVRIKDRLHEADVIVLAAGCWSADIEGLPDPIAPPVRPVKGQMMALQMEAGITTQKVIRTPRAKYNTNAYLVPKANGRLIVGATSEEMGFDTRLTAGGLFELLRSAWEAVPGIYDLPVLETWAGLRPGSRDNAPILGKTSVENLIMATGHYRNGILLTPVTAREISSLILTGVSTQAIAPFPLSRFQIG